MKSVSLKCPECCASLTQVHVKDGIINTYCTFCGHHIVLEDENTRTNIIRSIDETRIKELELLKEERELSDRKRQEFIQLLQAQKEKARKNMVRFGWIGLIGIILTMMDIEAPGALCVLCFIPAYLNRKTYKKVDQQLTQALAQQI